MKFEVIPAVDLKDGRCVQLIQGEPGKQLISLEDPIAEAVRWVDGGAKTLHLIDLDGAIQGVRKNAAVIKEILEVTDVSVEVGGGIRTRKDVDDLLVLGVDRVIIGTAAVNNSEFINELSDEFGKDYLMVSLDAKNGKVVTHGWAETSTFTPPELGKWAELMGAGSILFTDIDSEGLMEGVDPAPAKELVEAVTIPVVAAGGVTSVEDVKIIKQIGAAGVVVGSALYTGRLSLTDAIKAAEE